MMYVILSFCPLFIWLIQVFQQIPRSSVIIPVHPPPTPTTNAPTPLYQSKHTNNSNSRHLVFPISLSISMHPNTQTQTQAKESPYIQDQNILTHIYLNGPIYPSYKRHIFRVWCRNPGWERATKYNIVQCAENRARGRRKEKKSRMTTDSTRIIQMSMSFLFWSTDSNRTFINVRPLHTSAVLALALAPHISASHHTSPLTHKRRIKKKRQSNK